MIIWTPPRNSTGMVLRQSSTTTGKETTIVVWFSDVYLELSIGWWSLLGLDLFTCQGLLFLFFFQNKLTKLIYLFQYSSVARGRGQSAPLTVKNCQNKAKRGEIWGNREKGKNQERREKSEKSGRKGKNREGSFTLPLLTERASYATDFYVSHLYVVSQCQELELKNWGQKSVLIQWYGITHLSSTNVYATILKTISVIWQHVQVVRHTSTSPTRPPTMWLATTN